MKMEPLPKFGEADHMTIADFVMGVRTGLLTEDDGTGYYATMTEMSDVQVLAAITSLAILSLRDPRFTHVVWFNK